MKPEVSKYHISKHRYYELKHFCLQYNEWKRELIAASYLKSVGPGITVRNSNGQRPIENYICCTEQLKTKIELIEDAAKKESPELWRYILDSVTNEMSYDTMCARNHIPCSRVEWYEHYRRFFYILSKTQNLQPLI